MSATFNGSSAYLLTANNIVGGSTPTYPVLLGGWVKLANVTAAMVSFCIGDGASAAYDLMELQCRGDQPSDPVMALSAAGGGGTSFAQVNGLTAGGWLFVGAYFAANNSRRAILGSTLGTADAANRASTGLNLACLGARYWDGAPSSFHNGSMAEMFAASGFASGDITAIVTQLAAGSKPIHVAELAPSLTMYQPLSAGLNETGYVGPSWTATSMAYNAGDHPTMLQNPWLLLDMPMQDDAASTTVVDESEYENNGSTNDLTQVYSQIGPGGELLKCLSIDDFSNSNITISTITLAPGTDWTLAFTAKRPVITNPGIVCGGLATNSVIRFPAGVTNTIRIVDDNEDYYDLTITNAADWHSYSFQWRTAANEFEIFEDGISLGIQAGVVLGSFTIELLFDGETGYTNYQNMFICGVRVYSRALSLAEIQAEAARGGLWPPAAILTQNTRNLLFGGN